MLVDLRNNTVAQYKMNDNAANFIVVDSQGFSNGHHFGGETNTITVPGKINTALNFEGSNYVDTGNTFNDYFNKSFSVNLWMKPLDGIPPIPYEAIFGAIGTNSKRYYIWHSFPDGQILVSYNLGSGIGNMSLSTNFTFLDGPVNPWTMVTIIFEQVNDSQGRITAYTNGDLDEIGTLRDIDMTDYDINSVENAKIGVQKVGEFPFNGSIDNFCIFDKVLSQNEVDFLYNSGNGTEKLYDFAENINPNNKFFATEGDYDTRNNTPNNASKLIVSFVDQNIILRTANNLFDHVMVAGMPLSVSPCFFSNETTKFRIDNSRDFPNLTYFYVLDVIAVDDVSHQTLTDVERTTQFTDAKLYINRWNALNYLNTVETEAVADPTNTIVLFGVPLGQGDKGELIFNKTPYTIDSVEEFKEVAFMNNLVSVGRIGNNYYLIITTT